MERKTQTTTCCSLRKSQSKASMYMRLFDFGELLERLVRVARGKVGEARGTVRPVEAFPCGVLQTTLVQKLFNRRN